MYRIASLAISLVVLVIGAGAAFAVPASKEHPNIVLILSDDVGLL